MAKKSRSSMMTPRKRSKLRIRSKISGTTERPRISVFRSSKHIYAQLVVDGERRTVAAASTLDQEVLGRLKGAVTEAVKPVSCKSVAAARVPGSSALYSTEMGLSIGVGFVRSPRVLGKQV
jgi:ribosomal protein L18